MNHNERHPTPESYWVIPGKLIAGAYPASKYFEEETRRILSKLLSAGASHFIDLTSEGELPPYRKLLEEQAGWLNKETGYQKMSIRDMHTPDPVQMRTILDALDAAILKDHVVYVHCYAGIGRTGTVVGCYLARHGMDGAEALNTIARLRTGTANGWARSPETDEQAALVLNWKSGT